MSKTGLRVLCFVALCLLCPGTRAEDSASASRLNFVFFIADDMQRHMFNCLAEGDEPFLTPNLDRLAAEGTLMTEQYVSAPVCTPSRFTCLTGRYASRSTSRGIRMTIQRDGQSVVNWNTMILPGQVTLPLLLQKAGYRTGMVGKNHVIEVPGRKKVGYREDPRDPAVHARLQANQRLVCDAVKRCGFDYAAAVYHNNPDGNGPKALGSSQSRLDHPGGPDLHRGKQGRTFLPLFCLHCSAWAGRSSSLMERRSSHNGRWLSRRAAPDSSQPTRHPHTIEGSRRARRQPASQYALA
jgi:hypothetical protein